MKKHLALLLLPSLIGCWKEPPGQNVVAANSERIAPTTYKSPMAVETRKPAYWAKLQNGDLCCTIVDQFHRPPQPLQRGQSNLKETPHWNTVDGVLEMKLQTPEAGVGTVSMGIFTTPVRFGRDSNFTLSATFQKPNPMPSGGWAFAVVARTGELDDTPDLSKIQLSFRIKPSGKGAEARVQEVNGADFNKPAAYPLNASDQDYLDIASGKAPVTLVLTVNRKAGIGTAYLIVGGVSHLIRKDFPLSLFGAGSENLILTTAGPTLATDTDWGQTLSVEVTEFRIWIN